MTRMWFLIVPEQSPNSVGTWREVCVDTRKAVDKTKFRRPWDYFDTLCGHNHIAAVVSRVPPHAGD